MYQISPASNPTDATNLQSFEEAAAQLPLPYDSSEEYRRLLESVSSSKTSKVKTMPTGSDMDQYQHLMSREKRVLDTIDRVVNDSLSKKDDESSLLGLPVHTLALRSAGSLRALLDDLVVSRSIEDVVRALTDPLRRPYIGVALVTIGIIVGLLEIASI